ncbi:hypothetical protein L3X38_006348 [Prunus dulcis]|uniref:Uncharacterized protein n=1 Tax=Prunus dulcis TaxID=3755 RepID=A0AAD4ZSM6_PRUDU|nr:hypothetical protein L3X38_006348 [Prunus dulcis]
MSHDDARGFQFKVIENWDDIVDLCGKDKATGEGAEIGADATEKRGVVKDVIADLIARMALSFEEFIRADTKNLDLAEMLKALPIEKKKSMLLMFIARRE